MPVPEEDILEDCQAHEFEINCVLQMPWGMTFYTHALGIPYFREDRESMLFSKYLSAKTFGTTDTQDLLHTHMQDAGQAIKAKSGTKRIMSLRSNNARNEDNSLKFHCQLIPHITTSVGCP